MGLIMALLVLGPILEQFVAIRILTDVFLTAIVLSMLYIVTHKKRQISMGTLLAIFMLVSLWLKYFYNYDVLAATSMIIGVLFTVAVTAHAGLYHQIRDGYQRSHLCGDADLSSGGAIMGTGI
jgi:hypothetical protein